MVLEVKWTHPVLALVRGSHFYLRSIVVVRDQVGKASQPAVVEHFLHERGALVNNSCEVRVDEGGSEFKIKLTVVEVVDIHLNVQRNIEVF